MNVTRAITLSTVLALSALSSRAQNTPLPAAPTPAKPSQPTFALPPTSYAPTKDIPATTDTKPNTFCGVPEEGIFTLENAKVPLADRGQMTSYMRLLASQVFAGWSRTMSLGEKNAWGRARYLAVRFAINSDGTYDRPRVTVSSGKEKYDEHMLAAIQAHAAFDPPPVNLHRAMPVCIAVYYNTDLNEFAYELGGSWQKGPYHGPR